MSYAEAKQDRKRKRRNENLALILGLLQGVGSSIAKGRADSQARTDKLAAEGRAEARQIERDKIVRQHDKEMAELRANTQLEVADKYGSRTGSTPAWVAEGEGAVDKYGPDPESALAELAKRRAEGTASGGMLFDTSEIDKDERAIRRIQGRNKARGGSQIPFGEAFRNFGRTPPSEDTYDVPLPPEGVPIGAKFDWHRWKPMGDQQPVNDQETNPSVPRGTPDPQREADREALRMQIEMRSRARGQQGTGKGPMMGDPGGMQAGPVDHSQMAYGRMGDAYRRFMAGDPSGFMELQDLFGGVLPTPKGMGLDTNYPRNRYSGLGTTQMP